MSDRPKVTSRPSHWDNRRAVTEVASAPHSLGWGIDGPVEAVAVLRSLGTSREIRTNIDRLASMTGEITGWLVDTERPGWLKAPYREVAQPLEQALNSLSRAQWDALDLVLVAEDRLTEAGLEYDADMDCTKTIPGEGGGRPRRFVAVEIGRVWERLRGQYREETRDASYTSEGLRDRIRLFLESSFPPDLLTDQIIKEAIEYHVRTRRR